MRNCFVITGAPGSGKTPILRELIALGFAGVSEPAREVLAEQRAIDGQGVPNRDRALFLTLMLERSIADHQREAHADHFVFFDRGIPDLVGFADIFDLDRSAAEQAAKTHRYNPIVFAAPSWPEIYTTDDERQMSFEFAAAFGRRISEVYVELGYRLIEVPRESPSQRAAFIVNAVADLAG